MKLVKIWSRSSDSMNQSCSNDSKREGLNLARVRFPHLETREKVHGHRADREFSLYTLRSFLVQHCLTSFFIVARAAISCCFPVVLFPSRSRRELEIKKTPPRCVHSRIVGTLSRKLGNQAKSLLVPIVSFSV